MSIKDTIHDLTGAIRVTRARLNTFKSASDVPIIAEPIGDVSKELHPDVLPLVVTDIRSVGKNAKSVRFCLADDGKLPPFSAGQYISLLFFIDGKPLCRPYSISSAPHEARLINGFAEITVKDGGGPVSAFINRNLKIGDRLMGSMPHGQFYYEPLRDSRRIVALAGGVGITPFVSMAKEIQNGSLDVNLTILYGVESKDDILLRDVFDSLQCERVRIKYVFDQNDDSRLRMPIEPYLEVDVSFFVCGPQPMYRYWKDKFPSLGIPLRRVRFAEFGQPKDITLYPDYPAQQKDALFSLTVVRGVQKDIIPARANESLVTACERAGILLLTDCRSGECGFCRTKVLSGAYFICPENDCRRSADKALGYVHACATYPLSDIVIKIPIV